MKINSEDYRVGPKEKVKLRNWPTIIKPFCESKKQYEKFCLSSIIMSPLNSYVKMSPYETGDICIEPERVATSGRDFVLREGGPGVCQSRRTAPPTASTCQTTQIPVTARR